MNRARQQTQYNSNDNHICCNRHPAREQPVEESGPRIETTIDQAITAVLLRLVMSKCLQSYHESVR